MPITTRRDIIGGMASTPLLAKASQAAASTTAVTVGDFGVGGQNDLADTAAIQRAFDQAPIGGDLVFPPGVYRVDRPLEVRRQLNIVGHGATLLGDFGGNAEADLLAVNIVDEGNRDNRGMRIEGMNIGFLSGGRNAIAVSNRPPNIANIGMLIQNNRVGVKPDSTGHAIRLEGLGTHFNTVRDCQIENGIYLGCADGTIVSGCLIYGLKTAITAELIVGAFQTRIVDNGIVARDGALRVIAGSQIYFERNQIEQFQVYGANRSPRRASVWIEPGPYGARHIRIAGNNFGAGTNLETSIFVAGDCQDLFVDHNVFNISGGGMDIRLADARVRWTRIGPNNSLRGATELRPHLAQGDPLAVEDRGHGTFGVRKRGLRRAQGWTASPDLAFWKTLDSVVHWEGSLAGRASAGEAIGRLPEGFQPASRILLGCPIEGGGTAHLNVQPDGIIAAAQAVSGTIALGGTSFPARLREPYPSSDP